MKRLRFLLLIIIGCFCCHHLKASPLLWEADFVVADSLFKGEFYNEEIGLKLHLDLYNEDLEVPDMPFLGPVGGYMDGSIYGVWMLTSHKIKGKTATLRFTNDVGSDSQTILLTDKGDGTFLYETQGGNVVRRVEGRRLVKIAGQMLMKKKTLKE